MIRKYPWHFAYLIFIVLCLTNIFQKMKWSTSSDNLVWKNTADGLVCQNASANSLVKKGDLLISAQSYIIKNQIDLQRVIQKRKFCRYEIERDGLLRNVVVDVLTRYTPFHYYILVFAGIFATLLSINVLNLKIVESKAFLTPPIFHFLTLSFAGFLIFSPKVDYQIFDFIFLFLDRFAYLFFPALLVHFAMFFPRKLTFHKKISGRVVNTLIYIPPLTLSILNLSIFLAHTVSPGADLFTDKINLWRHISSLYFVIYLTLALVIISVPSLIQIFRHKQNKLLGSLAGLFISFLALIALNFLPSSSQLLNFVPFAVMFMPISYTYYLGRQRFYDIFHTIKRTTAAGMIFMFIFGISFMLGLNIEQNKLLGIFWPIVAILTGGLLYKPIEGTLQKYMEQIFFRGTYQFKIRLREVMQSLHSERNLHQLSTNFLSTINSGLQLQSSALLIHSRKNIFYQFPENNKILLSKTFCERLFHSDNLVFNSSEEFAKKFPRESGFLAEINYLQFLPLKTQTKLIGLVAFSQKNDQTYLSAEDWDLMVNISPSLTLSVENAFLYSEQESQLNEISLLKEFNENTIANLNLGLVVLSDLNIIRTWNPFMTKKFRIDSEEAINKKAHVIFGSNLWKQIHTAKGGILEINAVRIAIKEEEIVFNIHVSPLREKSGKIMGTILVFEDVTEQILMQNKLITSEKMASVGLLSAGIAHEINTPLTGISSYCQLILENPENKENTDLITKIQEQVQRANRIVRSLLDFSRQKGEHPQEVDLGKIIDESITLVDHQLKKQNVQLSKSIRFSGKIFGYPTSLQQLFINLLINACDAIEGPGGRIALEGTGNPLALKIQIRDNGQGIHPDDLPKIFDPFFTTKAKGKGTGLGLSIVYNIVKKHYGEILVDSEPGKGTIFTIHLPLDTPLRSMKI